MPTTPAPSKNTSAFFAQAGVSFAIALAGLLFALLYLPVDPWIRAFLAMTTLFLVSSSFTLAKVIRDAQDDRYVVSRIDQARFDKLLADHDLTKHVS
ncbi:YiaA/YiaB family inner membrane protein [Marmoricola sp. RAF53]|uniref:YiaA/YiaB family inner membrane protein n=1 Tax=Marmoricola sp. RAF53 TaxID=3233059 RepID=UPI003F9C9A01